MMKEKMNQKKSLPFLVRVPRTADGVAAEAEASVMVFSPSFKKVRRDGRVLVVGRGTGVAVEAGGGVGVALVCEVEEELLSLELEEELVVGVGVGVGVGVAVGVGVGVGSGLSVVSSASVHSGS
jgi:hypothetical protein